MTVDYKALFEMWKTGTPVIELVKSTGMERSKLGKELYKLAGGPKGWNELRAQGAGGTKRRATAPTTRTVRSANPRTPAGTVGSTKVDMAANEALGARAEITDYFWNNHVKHVIVKDLRKGAR